MVEQVWQPALALGLRAVLKEQAPVFFAINKTSAAALVQDIAATRPALPQN
ncbi:MAG: hypothetical protein ACOYNF_16475 [Rhodoferax sp.]